MHPQGPMPWNDERLRELHFPCAFFEHQGSVLTLACSNPGPSPTCPGQNCLWGGGSQTHAPTPLISVPCSTLVRELSPDTSSLLSRHIQRLSSAVFVMSQNPRDCAEPAKNVGSAAAPGPSIPASEHLQVRVGWAAASHRCPHISSSSHVEDGQTSLHRSASAASSQETQTYSGPSKESNTVAGPGVRNNCPSSSILCRPRLRLFAENSIKTSVLTLLPLA